MLVRSTSAISTGIRKILPDLPAKLALFSKTPQLLELTNKTLKVGSSIYLLHNLTCITLEEIKPKYLFKILVIFISLSLGIGLLFVQYNLVKWLGIFSLFLGLLGLLERLFKKSKHGLILETVSSRQTVINSSDKDFMENLLSTIHEAMNYQDTTFKCIFNLEDSSVYLQEKL